MCEKYTVSLEASEADVLFTAVLKEQLAFVQRELDTLEKRSGSALFLPIYSADPAEEKAELEMDKAAMIRILEYYGAYDL